MSDAQVIFHHYPQSPVSEKVRVVFGFKGMNWKSVQIPRLPPKPNLTALTGGYRLTPVMQIGADIYCDTSCIIREIERRFPTPTLFPAGGEGQAWGVARWTDGPLFQDVVTVALVEMSPNMPPEFLADRGPLYFGPDFSLAGIKARYDESLANVRTQFGWIDGDLAIAISWQALRRAWLTRWFIIWSGSCVIALPMASDSFSSSNIWWVGSNELKPSAMVILNR